MASALALKDAGVQSLVLERAEGVAAAWRGRYDRLRLNTARPFSHLPGRPFPKGTPMFPTRDQLVEHVERHAGEEGLRFRFRTTVEEITRGSDGWTVRAGDGELRSPQVIVATSYQNEPVLPAWEGRESFHGRLLHAVAYRNPEPFEGQRVLVVGAGSSGMEIAHDLVEGGAAAVWLSVRTPPNILLRELPGGIPNDVLGVALMHVPAWIGDAVGRVGRRLGIGDLSAHGLPVPEVGAMSQLQRQGRTPAIVDREVIDAIRARRIAVVAAVDSFAGDAVRLADGSALEPDAVVCATGYRPSLESLVGGLGILDARGMPRALGEKPAAPGLRFIGYVPRPGGLGYWGRQAKRAAKAIARELGARR